METSYVDFVEFDMSYGEFKQLCREARKDEEYNFIYFDGSKKKNEGRYCICNESKKTYAECIPETSPF